MNVPKNKPIRLKGAKLTKLMQDVVERDGYTCQGETCPGGYPLDRPHHIKLKSQGGSDTMENLVLLCTHCHAKRHGVNVVGRIGNTTPF